jgi:hypothetical protein
LRRAQRFFIGVKLEKLRGCFFNPVSQPGRGSGGPNRKRLQWDALVEISVPEGAFVIAGLIRKRERAASHNV